MQQEIIYDVQTLAHRDLFESRQAWPRAPAQRGLYKYLTMAHILCAMGGRSTSVGPTAIT